MSFSLEFAETPARPNPFAELTAVAVAILALILAWSLLDERMVSDAQTWVKPAKFATSFVVHFATMAVIVAGMGEKSRSHAVVWTAAIMATAFLSEMIYLIFQASQAEASHFNVTTQFHQIMYQMMGAGAVLLIAGPVIVAWVASREAGSAFGPATRSGLVWGAGLSFGLTLVVAGYLSTGVGHHVGTPSDNAATLPLFGWSAEVGDLRPSHFLSLHALQILPLAGLMLDRMGQPAGRLRYIALGYAALTAAVFVQALAGLPLIRL